MKRLFIFLLITAVFTAGCAGPAVPVSPTGEESTEAPVYLQIGQEQARLMMEQDDGHVVVDVRRQDEYDAGHIPGAICIPNENIGTEHPEELPDTEQIILIYCRSGNRSKQAAEKLGNMGYRNVYEFGGIIDWTGEIVTETGSDDPAEPDVPDAPVDPDEYIGSYENDNYDSVLIRKSEDGYSMSVSLYRLVSLDEGTVSASPDGLVFQTADGTGNPMTLLFRKNGESYELRVEESTWPELALGTVIHGLTKAADTAPDRQSHYTFRPKVCSSYMTEVYGQTMCDTWFSIVDAVMEGKDTFVCPDVHTYDWVMGQFPEQCFPVLYELIDFAWDRNNAVNNGSAHFTYLVPPDEAAARIKEFGEQIEGILNEVLEDDYTDLEKALALYDYFSQNYKYDYEVAERIKTEDVPEVCCMRFFRTGTGICSEISTAYSYLLMQAGVEATVMSGTRSYDRAPHQWSYVRINGHDFHIDPTYVISDKGSLAYFMMTDEQREAEDFARDTFYITSNYSRENPHPDYTADDDAFRTVWQYSFESFIHESSTLLCWKYDDSGEITHIEFDYTGY